MSRGIPHHSRLLVCECDGGNRLNLFANVVWVCKGEGGGGQPPFKNTLTSYSNLPYVQNLP